MAKHSKGVSSLELTFEYRLNVIHEELIDIKFDADDCEAYSIAHKLQEAEGPLRQALIAARHINEKYGTEGVWT